MATKIAHRQKLESALRKDGVRGALAYLNSLTNHRFTALYRFDDETLRNLYFFDREDPSQESTPDIPVLASYCVFVRRDDATFTVPDAPNDQRVAGHPKQLVVRSYCGVPLRDLDGTLFGTLCHFDFERIPVSPQTIDLMESIAPLLRSFLPERARVSGSEHAR
jgi:GAF domain-containing protein